MAGAEVDQALAPRSGTDATTGFSALDKLRAIHNDWTKDNPPRLERVARVDLLNFATGLEFEQAYANRVIGILGGVEVGRLDKDALDSNKLATGRTQDFADAEAIAPERLGEIRDAMKKKLLESD